MSIDNFTTLPGITISLLNAEEKRFVYQTLERHGVRLVRIMPNQRLALHGITSQTKKQIEMELTARLPINNGIKVSYVQACPGLRQCRYAVADALSLGRKIEALSLSEPLPHKVKVAVAGCRICCTEPWVRDIGIIASRKGWTVVFGGNAGGKPRIADQLATGLDEDAAVALIEKSLRIYSKLGRKRQRTARFIEQFGIDRFKELLFQKKSSL